MPTSSELKEQNLPHPKKATVVGDSTLDNKFWIYPGPIWYYIYNWFGIKRDPSQRIVERHQQGKKLELSVVENLMVEMPHTTFCDYTNDGFTTSDCLRGASRNKVFGGNVTNLFPNEFFSPLNKAEQDIATSDVVIVSVGGNNFREFLQTAFSYQDPAARDNYIRREYDRVFRQLESEYLEIIARIRKINPKAKIVMLTQYYPSIIQTHYSIYGFMGLLNRALFPNSQYTAWDTIQSIVEKTYKRIFATLQHEGEKNAAVVDVTSSLNPFDSTNHVSQIEPSGKGGQQIARMIKHVAAAPISGTLDAYSFTQDFFENNKTPFYITKQACYDWYPKHPIQIIAPNIDNTELAEKVIGKENLQKAIAVTYQTTNSLVNFETYRKLKDNAELQAALAAAYDYLNSGRFGYFRTHGKHGIGETKYFVARALEVHRPDYDLKAEIQAWLKTSNVHNSSRAAYAYRAGLFASNNRQRDAYDRGSAHERRELLKEMLRPR